ncbi:MAG: hypothetical protein M9929_00870 [Burkholderiaceae bacterium]|nr:hypothetical protein [Burkholderiaceae bacterium]
MKMYILGFGLIAFSLNGMAGDSLPDGWKFYEKSSKKSAYEAGSAFYLRGTVPGLFLDPKSTESDSGQFYRSFSPSEYLGKRISISMSMKFEPDGIGYGGVWVNVRNGSELVMGGWEAVSEKEGQRWVKREIVLDVPEKSSLISLGAQIFGNGHLWFKDVKIEVVSEFVKVKNLFPEFKMKKE